VTEVTAAITQAGGSVVDFGPLPESTGGDQIPSSYDFRLVVSRKMYDRAVGTAMSPSIAKLGVGAGARMHPLDLPRVGVDDGTEVKLISASGSVVLPLIGDPTVQRGTIWAPFNQAGADISDIVDAAAAVTDVRVERLS
jgi:NADH-quinone oxidoreductase subunit G